ncbi:MAG: PorV/PorQ family protein [candidate division Zixibacteria bacterium]|nr:PorV/PorQ family protein [candidate division Zixibacteria bacterium]
MIKQSQKPAPNFKISFSLLCILLVACISYSQATEYSAGVESIFSYGASARAMGMGGAFVAIADDASAVYYNPAGMSALERFQLSGLHVSLWEGVNYDCLHFVYPTLDYGFFGIGIMRIGVDDIVRRDEHNIERGEFGFHQEQYHLAYSLHLTQNLSFGVSGKIASQSLAGYHASGFSSDFAVLFRAPGYRQLSFGLNLQDMFSTGLKLKTENERLPLNLKGGIGYEVYYGNFDNRIRFALDIDKTERRDPQLHFGMESDWFGNVFLRSGVDNEGFNMGGGVSVGFIGVDYAFVNSEAVGNVHRFSVRINFGKPLSIQLRERIALEESINQERLATFSRLEKMSSARYYHEQGDSLAEEGKFEKAELAYNNALAWYPDYEPAKESLSKISSELDKIREKERKGLIRNLEVEFCLDRAKQFAEDEDYRKALNELENVFTKDPDNTEALALKEVCKTEREAKIQDLKLRAYTAYKQKDYTSAYRQYRQLLEIIPEDEAAEERLTEISNKLQAALHLKQGLGLFHDGNYSLSVAEFQTALKYDPNDSTCTAYLDRSKNMLAGTTTLQELKEDPSIWELYIEGIKAYQNKDYKAAIENWEQVLSAYPTNVNTQRNIEQARRLSQRNDKN